MEKMSSKGAMEMSVGTIVTIVLLMSVLVLGLFFVQRIFQSGENAIDSIDSEVQNEITKLFSDGTKTLVIYPSSQEITFKRGDSLKGFAFSVRNKDVEPADYTYEVSAKEGFDYSGKCGSTMTIQKANSYILLSEGEINNLGAGQAMELPELVKFTIPEEAPPCTIPYGLKVSKVGGSTDGATIYVIIK